MHIMLILMTLMPMTAAATIYAPVERKATDGQMSFTLTQDNIGKHANLAYQVTPWMMMGANYVQLNRQGRSGLRDSESRLSDARFSDLSFSALSKYDIEASFRFDMAVKLRQASGYLPAIHLGMRDFTDQADLQSPFGVASWYHNQWQFELGADTHPYGNIRYTHSRYPVTFQASYHAQGRFLVDEAWYAHSAVERGETEHVEAWVRKRARPATFMLSSQWEFQPGLEVGLSVGDNNHWGLSLRVTLDSQRTPVRYEAPSSPYQIAGQSPYETESLSPSLLQVESKNAEPWDIRQAFSELDINLHSVVASDERLMVAVSQSAYPYWPDAIDQAHALITDATSATLPSVISSTEPSALPSSIGSVDYVIQTDTVPMMRVHKDINRNALFDDFSDTQRIHALTAEDLAELDINWLMTTPQWRVSLEHQGWLADAQTPIQHVLQASVAGQWQFASNWSVLGQINVDLAEDVMSEDAISEESISGDAISVGAIEENTMPAGTLTIDPRFSRTQARDIHIPQLALQYHDTQIFTQFDHQASLHYQVTGGYLADNWAGIGLDILYQPWQSRLAYGVSVAQLRGRDINGLLSLADEQSALSSGDADTEVVTALGSVFWGTPFYDIDVALHAGRFVGQDTGAKFELRRTFDNGWQFGIWGSRTQLNGQSQSDHGLYLSIPLDTALAKTGTYTRHVDFNSHINQLENTTGIMLPYGAVNAWWGQRAAFKSLTTQRESTKQRQLNTANTSDTWLLVVGGYEVTGQVRYLKSVSEADSEALAGYYQFESAAGDSLRFNESGLISIEQVGQKPLNMSFTDIGLMRQVQIGELNYAAYGCSELKRDGFSASQRCNSQPAHRIDLQYDKDFTPVRIAQWLVYLNQHLELKRLN